MAIIGYARVSTADQDTTLQVEALRAAGCTVIRHEKVSGTSTAGRVELAAIMDFIRSGDVLVVTRLDRLARSTSDLLKIVQDLHDRGAALRATEQTVDTSGATGKFFLTVLAAVAEFETGLRRERQLEGIAKAKAKGIYKGRRPSIDPSAVRTLHGSGVGPADIARQLGIGRASVYRALAAE